MIEKILSEIQKLILQNEEGANACYPSAMARESAYYECKEIVQEVAKEYGKDTNVRSNGWIPCSERLPEDRTEVLAWFSNPNMHSVAWYSHEHKVWFSNDFVTEDSKYVLAWQSLPAPYQKGE